MTRRPPASVAALVAALAVLASWTGTARAAALGSNSATYRLIYSAPAGSPALVKVAAGVLPPGAIVPPVVGTDPQGRPIEGSPVTILPGSTGVRTDPAPLVALGSGTTSTGEPAQAIGFDFGDRAPDEPFAIDGEVEFGASGLSPGGMLEFALNLANGVTPPLLVLPPTATAAGLALANVPTAQPVTPTPVPVHPVPEPATVLAWSGLAALALVRARVRARRLNA